MVDSMRVVRSEDKKYDLEVRGRYKELFRNGVFCSYCRTSLTPPFNNKVVFCEMNKKIFCKLCAIYKEICRHDAKKTLFPDEVGSNHIHFNINDIIFLDD